MRNPERFEFIKNLREKEDTPEFYSMAEAQAFEIIEIGTNTRIHTGVVIGTDGLGFERDQDGKLLKFPHFGKVKIGSNVEIFPNCVIHRGSLGDTIIGDGCKIGGCSQIGHNVNLGRNVLIGSHVVICGSAKIKDNVNIWSHSTVDHGIEIGQECEVGAHSYVRNNLPPNAKAIGVPAEFTSEYWTTL